MQEIIMMAMFAILVCTIACLPPEPPQPENQTALNQTTIVQNESMPSLQ